MISQNTGKSLKEIWEIENSGVVILSHIKTSSKDVVDTGSWYIIPANKKWFRNLAVGLIIVDTIERMKPKFPKPAINLSKIVIDN